MFGLDRSGLRGPRLPPSALPVWQFDDDRVRCVIAARAFAADGLDLERDLPQSCALAWKFMLVAEKKDGRSFGSRCPLAFGESSPQPDYSVGF